MMMTAELLGEVTVYAASTDRSTSLPLYLDPFAPQRTRLEMREALKNIKDWFYQIEEKAA